MSTDQIISRIQKLLALSKSSNEHEAAAAAGRAAELMREHQIEEAQIRVKSEAPAEPIEKNLVDRQKRKQAWKGRVAQAVASSLGCHMWWSGGDINMLGRRGAVQTANYLYQYVIAEIDRLAHDCYAKTGQSLGAAAVVAWKNAFRHGAGQTVSNRLYEELHKHNTNNARKLAEGGADTQALVLVRNDQLAVNTEWKQFSAKFGTVAPGRISSVDGYNTGRVAGASIALKGGGARLGAAPAKLRSR